MLEHPSTMRLWRPGSSQLHCHKPWHAAKPAEGRGLDGGWTGEKQSGCRARTFIGSIRAHAPIPGADIRCIAMHAIIAAVAASIPAVITTAIPAVIFSAAVATMGGTAFAAGVAKGDRDVQHSASLQPLRVRRGSVWADLPHRGGDRELPLYYALALVMAWVVMAPIALLAAPAIRSLSLALTRE
jgi:hypothetical protein